MVQLIDSVSTRCATLSLIEGGLLLVKILKNSEIDIEESKLMHKVSVEITKGEKIFALIDARTQVIVSREAREWGSSPESLKDTVAQAILVNSLANKLIGNFIIQFHKPIATTKLFSDEAAAIEWLKEQKRIYYTK